jgi:predicted DNA-binding transcriptional regulator YafY
MAEERMRSLGELASKVGKGGVTPRTLRRDIEALQEARFR